MDINVGMWIAQLTTGNAWQIVSVSSKTDSTMTLIVQDIYRYNTFKDTTQSGNGAPGNGFYVAFELGDNGQPVIAGNIEFTLSFLPNLLARYDYSNLQYDLELYQDENTFEINDVIAVDSATNSYVKATSTFKTVIGRITSVSDTAPGWFTVNPTEKIADFLDYLPGDVGDTIYSSTTDPSGVSTDPNGAPIYVKLRNNTSSETISLSNGPTTSGNGLLLNGIDITIGGSGSSNDLISAANNATSSTGVIASASFPVTSAQSNTANTKYGQVLLFIGSPNAIATINGVSVTFDIPSTDDPTYSFPKEMAQAINAANIPNIVASANQTNSILTIKNTVGGAITITNVTPDSDGQNFAGPLSGTGLPLDTPAATSSFVKFTAIDARPIEFLNLVGSPVDDFGLISVENGIKAAGMYVQSVSSGGGGGGGGYTVVDTIADRDDLTPTLGDIVYVRNSSDGVGNFVNEWSTWVWTGSAWTLTGRQSSATVGAKSIGRTIAFDSASSINIGKIPTGSRVTLITVEVITAFDGGGVDLSIGYSIDSTPPVTNPTGLLTVALMDLGAVGVYSTASDILFGTDTVTGDVTLTASYTAAGSTVGEAQIIVTYV
jgi:hypothetical protein